MEKITDKELELLKILWEKGELCARDVFDETLKTSKRSYHTIKTTLDIMYRKGYLKRRRVGARLYMYDTVEPKEKTVRRAVDKFVNDFLDNSIVPLFKHFVQQDKISRKEITELKEIIDELEE